MKIPTEIKISMAEEAIKKENGKPLSFPGNPKTDMTFSDCFVLEELLGVIVFYYNTPDNNTGIIVRKLN